MANLGGFNAHDVAPADSFDPIPAGKYLAAITESEQVATKSGDGSFLKLTFQILDGACKGRKLWSRLNLTNRNAQAVEIARGQLSAICRAVGVMTPRDSQELHNLPLAITVKVAKRDDTGEHTNEIKAFAHRDTLAQPTAPTGRQAIAGVANKAPWQR